MSFMGPNGAAKSTTIKILTGILHPTAGEATVLGLTPWKDREKLAYRIGSVFGQKSQLWLHLPASDTFELLSRVYELDRTRYHARRKQLIELFEIGDYAGREDLVSACAVRSQQAYFTSPRFYFSMSRPLALIPWRRPAFAI